MRDRQPNLLKICVIGFIPNMVVYTPRVGALMSSISRFRHPQQYFSFFDSSVCHYYCFFIHDHGNRSFENATNHNYGGFASGGVR